MGSALSAQVVMPLKGGLGSVLRCVTYTVVILEFILAERTVSLNKKCYQASMEVKKKYAKSLGACRR